jgi:hypothetical protein
MKQERDLINEILLRASERGARLFRQNTGRGWVGRLIRHMGANDTTVTLADARPLIAGLCVGSSDIIGWTPVVITQEMVGRTVGVFTAFEAKTQGVATTKEQRSFIGAAHKAGCIAEVVFSADEALALLP